jgi:hypothetical protein
MLSKAELSRAKQNKVEQCKTKQSKAKQGNTTAIINIMSKIRITICWQILKTSLNFRSQSKT